MAPAWPSRCPRGGLHPLRGRARTSVPCRALPASAAASSGSVPCPTPPRRPRRRSTSPPPPAAAADLTADLTGFTISDGSPAPARPPPPPGGDVPLPSSARVLPRTGAAAAPAPPPPDPTGPPIPPEDYPPGRVVAARVIKVGRTGLQVRMLDEPRVLGFVPDKELRPGGGGGSGHGGRPPPGRARAAAAADKHAGPALPLAIGDVREFVVTYLPRNAALDGVGPTLSARRHDDNVRWSRARSLAAACRRDGETVAVVVEGANSGGLVTRLAGLPAFVPYSQVDVDELMGPGWAPAAPPPPRAEAEEGAHEEAGAAAGGGAAAPAASDSSKDRRRPPGSAFLSSPADRAAAVGRTIHVVPTSIDREASRIVLSMRKATEARARAALAVGALVWGTVRRVEAFGVFIGIDNTRDSALLHVSNISRLRCNTPGDVFGVGDRVRALIVGMDEGARRISLSTAELEAEDGDMLDDRDKVYAGAPEQAKVFLDHLATLTAEAGEDGQGGGGGEGGTRKRGGRRGGDDGGGGDGGAAPLDW